MKVKQLPEDFRVEELTAATASESGEFAFYRLDKTGWTTPDALAAIRRRWQVDLRRLSYGGLKDRHAVTSQHLTIFRGPRRNLSHERIAVTYLGQRPEPFGASDIAANRFTITLRAMTAEQVRRARSALEEVSRVGVPNYFDDQRFGSVSDPPEFVAKELVLGCFERALWLALSAPYEHDRAEAKREKATLRKHWNDWPACKAELGKCHARSIVDYLVHHPTDFKGAVARLRPEMHGLYLSAYQSYLWNRMLGEWLTGNIGSEDLAMIPLKLGEAPAPVRMAEEKLAVWQSLVLPLPSARLKPAPDSTWGPLVERVLQQEGLTLAEVKIKGMQKPFFSKGDRAACIHPAKCCAEEAADDLQPAKRKVLLRFDLPRGAYATMVIKRITSSSYAM
jgi:tRNA pseudouridine13 synthase